MKFYFLLLIILLCSLKTSGQNPHHNYGNPLYDSIFVKGSVKNILYVGIDNILHIDTSCTNNCNILYVTDNGIMFEDEDEVYIIPSHTGRANVELYNKTSKDTLPVINCEFWVKNTPKPILMIGEKRTDKIHTLHRQDLINCDSLYIFFSSDIIGSENWLTIEKFILGYKLGPYFKSHNNPGNKLTEETKQIISNLTPGTNISIRTVIRSEGAVFRDLPVFNAILL